MKVRIDEPLDMKEALNITGGDETFLADLLGEFIIAMRKNP